MSDDTIENEKEAKEVKQASNTTLHYFSTLKQEKNKLFEYQYKPPIFGESNTDISYYEPNSSRIANMSKSAGAFEGLYDFDENKKVDIEDAHVPFGRKLGLTFEEVSQMETINNQSIQATNKNDVDADEAAKKNIKEAVEIAKAISDSSKIQVSDDSE